MNDVAVVRVRQSIGDFAQNATHFHRRYWPVLLQTHPEVIALDVRHHEVDEIVALFDRVDRNDVRMIQLRGRLGFAKESLSDVGAETELGRQHLDRDLALQPSVARAIHDSHTATTDFGL